MARGGLWGLAQLPLMLLAILVPIYTGTGQLVPADPLAWLGVSITLSGWLLIVWGFASLGKALTPFPVPLSNATLRRRGSYRFMRHPIYSGVMLASLGWAVWWLSVGGFVCVLLLAIFFDRKATYEEQWLQRQYSDYADYVREVKKFIPGLY